MMLPSGWIFIPKMKDALTITVEQRELITCAKCRHRDLKSGKCNSGGMPWDTQFLPVPDDWYCPNAEAIE